MKYIKLTRSTVCAGDEHEMLYYPRASFVPKPELPVGTILKVSGMFSNLYGTYYKCKTRNGLYYIPIRNTVEIENP